MADINELLAQIDAADAPAPLSTSEKVLGFSRSYLDGPLFNYQGEAESGLAALRRNFMDLFSSGPDKSLSEHYYDKLNEVNAQQGRFKEAVPYLDNAVEIGSSLVLNPLGAAGKIAKGTEGIVGLLGRAATSAPAQGAIAMSGMTKGNENLVSDIGKGALFGSLFSGGASVIGKGLERAGINADRLKLSAYGVGTADISRQIRKMGDDVESLGTIGNVPIVNILNKAEKAGIIDASNDMLQNFKGVAGTQDEVATQLRNVLSAVDDKLPGNPSFQLKTTNRYIESLSGTAQQKADDAASAELRALYSQMGEGKLADLQKLKIGLNYKFDQNPYAENVIKAIRSDLKQEIENRANFAATAGAIPKEMYGQVKSLNSTWGNLADLNDVFKKGIAKTYGGDVVEDAFNMMRTSGGQGNLNIASAATGNPVYAAIGGMLNIGRFPESKSILGDVARSGQKPLTWLGRQLPEVVTGRSSVQAVGPMLQNKEDKQMPISEVAALVQQIDELRSTSQNQTAQQQSTVSAQGQGQSLQALSTPRGLFAPQDKQSQSSEGVLNPSVNNTANSVNNLASDLFTKPAVTKKDIAAVESLIDSDVYDAAVYEVESSRNPKAKNKTSTAAGGFQLINKTAKSLGVEDPYDLAQNYQGFLKLKQENIERFGDDPKMLYAAHFLGGTVLGKLQRGAALTAKQQETVDEFTNKALPRFLKIYSKIQSKQVEA